MARKSEPPRNRRTTPPENRRSLRPAARPPLRARFLVWRERMRVRLSAYKKAGRIGAGIVVAAAAVSGLLAAGKLIRRHVTTSPAFATQLIEVHGGRHLSRDEVLHAAGLAIGQNVFARSPSAAQAALLRDPWIEAATVQRRLPATFDVEIHERRAIALLALDFAEPPSALGGQLYLVGADGSAFKPLGPGDPADLPVITGLDPEQVQNDRRGSASALVSAVSLLHDYEDAGLLRKSPVSEIHVEDDGTLSMYVGTSPTYVRLGRAPFRGKLTRLREVFSQLRKQEASAAYVYLDNEKRPDRVTVRLR